MDDLEVLCRDCHKAHHAAEHKPSKKRGIKKIHRRRIHDKLTAKHVDILSREFDLNGQKLFMVINYGNPAVAQRAAQLLGFSGIQGYCAKEFRKNKPAHYFGHKQITQVDGRKGFACDCDQNRWKKLANMKELTFVASR